MQPHRFDPVSLIAGMAFGGLSLALLTGRVTPGARHLNLVWALGAILLGLALLSSGVRSRESGNAEVGATPEVPAPSGTAAPNEEE